MEAITQQVRQAQVLLEQQQLVKAEEILKGLFTRHPEHPEVLFALGQLARKTGAKENAMQLIGKAAYLLPEQITPLLGLAEVMSDLQRFDHAESCYQRAVSKFPDDPEAYFRYCGFLMAQGRFAQAEKWVRRLLDLSPDHAGGLSLLAQLKPVDKPLKSRLVKAVENASKRGNKADEIRLRYALGKALDEQNNTAEAFDFWRAANHLQLSQCDFRVAQMTPFFQAVKNAFNAAESEPSDAEQQSLRQSPEQLNVSPIFIVGLPRSGSTLLEQMLAAHPAVDTAGEVDYLASEVAAKITALTGQEYPAGLADLTREQSLQLGQSYLRRLKADCAPAASQSPAQKAFARRWIIDKLPANFQSIGLIKKVLPHAIIVHITRTPMAVAFSIFRNYFEMNEPYFCDLTEFKSYYREYQQMMEHWARLYPDGIIEIAYEDLVDSPKASLTKILRACGLDWHENCLAYFRQQNFVTTLSSQQVRQPLYQTAKTKWRAYEAFLSPIFDA